MTGPVAAACADGRAPAPAGLTDLLDRLDDLVGVVADRVGEPAHRPRAAGAGVLAGGACPPGLADLVAAAEDAHRPDPSAPSGPPSPALAALAAGAVEVTGTLPPRDVLDRAARARSAERRAALTRDALDARAWARRRRVAVRGGTLDYVVTGSGPPVVVLEALGHDLTLWRRLIGGLATRRRVIAWAPRTSSRSGPPLLADQVDDLEAVLAAEGLRGAAVVGWCTGPKVALAWEDREPDRCADALVMLNPSFRVSGRPQEPDTPHERNLETLCRSVLSRPRSVTALRRMVSAESGPAAAGHDGAEDDDAAVARILSAPPPALAPALRLPFADDASLIGYAVQLLDFWAHDALDGPPRRPTPTLVVSGDRDTVAGPEALATALPRLPHARHVAMPGASHHLLHDRADVLARLVHEFLDTVPHDPTRQEDR